MNLYRLFRELVPDQPIDVVTVASVETDGSIRCTTLAGAVVVVRGDGSNLSPSDTIFIRGGQFVGLAPAGLTAVNVDV